jgi:hypothetical protein
VDRPTQRDAPSPCRVAETHAARHHPTLVLGDAEDSENLGRVKEPEDGGERTSDAFGPRRQLRTPYCREDRPSGRIGLDESEEEQGHLFEVIGEPLGRSLNFSHLDAFLGLRVCLGRCQPVDVDGLPKLVDRVSIERSDLRDHLGVVDQQEAPVLGISLDGARIAASRILAWTSTGTGSGRTRRMARVVWSASWMSISRFLQLRRSCED